MFEFSSFLVYIFFGNRLCVTLKTWFNKLKYIYILQIFDIPHSSTIMAKLGAYYGLCPLIDQRNLLGVTEDSETGHAIVTLGRNIAIRYRFSDQKQIDSWRTKDKFSSPVIYDRESNHYVAVFNQVYIRMWKGDEEYLDKLKKYKLNKQVHTLVRCSGKSFVVFKDGNIVALNIAIEQRKYEEYESARNNQCIIEDVLTLAHKDVIYIGLLCSDKKTKQFYWTTFNGSSIDSNKIELSVEHSELVGYTLSLTESQLDAHLLTLWSNGKMHSYSITNQDESQRDPPGNVFAVVESLTCKSSVTMIALNHHYIGMYGADTNEEGATLILYNSQFKVSQSKQPLKLFTARTKLWHVENNLLLCVGQNLAVVPFHLDAEHLSALIGSHRTALADLDPDITVVENLENVIWDSTSDERAKLTRSIPDYIRTKVLELANQGLSESIICQVILPNFIEENNVKSITSCLEYFRDIPEVCIPKLVHFCLTANPKLFKNARKINADSLPSNLQPLERCMLLDKILMCPFNEVFLLPFIQAQLDLNCSILLLQYICYLMSEDGHLLPLTSEVFSENKLIEWGSLLLDANYQKLLLSNDPKIYETLVYYIKLVDEYLNSLESLRELLPLLKDVQKGKENIKHRQIADVKYSIEQLGLY